LEKLPFPLPDPSLIHGTLTADHYESDVAADPRIDQLRDRMEVVENPQYTRDYLDPEKRSIANAIQVFFKDGTQTERIEVEYPLGHRRRRAESRPVLDAKFKASIEQRFDAQQCDSIVAAFAESDKLDAMPIDEFMALFVTNRPL